MPITKKEYFNDKVRVHYHLRKPFGMDDEITFKEICYEEVDKLPQPPKFIPDDLDSIEEVYISDINKTILFRHRSHLESAYAGIEQDMDGPFLRK